MPTKPRRRKRYHLVVLAFLLSRLFVDRTFGEGNSDTGTTNFEQPAVLTGRIYDISNTNKLLFTFRRTAVRTNSTVNVLREFRTPDGHLAARETVRYESGRLSAFELEEPPSGDQARITVQPDPRKSDRSQIAFEYSENRGRSEGATEALQPDTLIADMIGPFIEMHWNQLMRGDSVKFRFAAVARRETVGFKFVKESEAWRAGKPVARLKMQPTSILISPFVDPLYFTVEKASPHRVLDYTGRTTPRMEKNGEWKDIAALTVFDWPVSGE